MVGFGPVFGLLFGIVGWLFQKMAICWNKGGGDVPLFKKWRFFE